jgi:virginiamycin B lyase
MYWPGGRSVAVGAAALVLCLVLSLGSPAVAAPVGALKQFKVPTANSEPRDITNGADGNRWFTEGTEFTNAPAKIGRITPAGVITEFAPGVADGCNVCIMTDIQRGPGDILYITSNDPFLMIFNVQTQSFEAPVATPNSNALAGSLAVDGDHVWITDFNNDVVWRYDSTTGVFDGFPASNPSDVAVDSAGNAWFTEPQANNDLSTNIGRIGANASPSDSNAVTRTVTATAARTITVSPTDGKVWFAARFPSGQAGQAVGFLDPADNNNVTVFAVADTGPGGIAAAPDGTIWFTQELTDNIARISNAGAITEGKAVKGSTPVGVTVAPNGNPWYTMTDANKIATLQLR